MFSNRTVLIQDLERPLSALDTKSKPNEECLSFVTSKSRATHSSLKDMG